MLGNGGKQSSELAECTQAARLVADLPSMPDAVTEMARRSWLRCILVQNCIKHGDLGASVEPKTIVHCVSYQNHHAMVVALASMFGPLQHWQWHMFSRKSEAMLNCPATLDRAVVQGSIVI